MKRIPLSYLWLFLITLLISCTPDSVQEIENGVIVSLPVSDQSLPNKMKIEVINQNIFRVSATPKPSFPSRNSLIIVGQKEEKPNFTISRSSEYIEIATEHIKANVSLESGSIQFTDLEGNTLLQELAGGGKTFSPIEVDNSAGYSFQQRFESPTDEAFFGLGQHQSDEWNYKGKNEVLYQYNTKVSVPFIISNKNYGILWDNYSLTKFGDVREYSEFSQFKLYDADGEEGGLTATYTAANGDVFTKRRESEIDYENISSIDKFPEDFPFLESNINWEGEIEPKLTGEYEFKLYYAGYTIVFIDGKEVVPERWRTAWNPNTYKFRVQLEAGKKVPVSVQWRPNGGISYLGLKALGPLDPLEQGRLSLWSEMGQELDYYFIHGEDMDQVIGGYRTLTGKAPIMPQWAYGFWQSRERYKTQDEIVGTLAEFRQRKIPIDNIVQDWSYWEENQWGSHEFETSRFPDPRKMVEDIHNMDAHVMISVWPKFYINTEHYKELDEKGWMYKQAVNDSIRDWISGGFIGSFYDAYSEGARKLFWEQMEEHLYTLGIDAWWMDASEPDILSNASLDYRKQLSGPTAMGPSTEFLNTYALVNADAIYNGQRKTDPNKRVFLLTRSGFAGLQRYSTALWSGDIGTRWEDMKAQISAGLNFALSGIPYWTMDIGGFCVENRYENAKEGSEDLKEWRELNTRWYQFGAFVPIFRAHGQYPYREVFNLAPEDHPAYRSIVRYNQLRYRLMPYIYSLAGRIYFDDYTLMRPLVMDFPEDGEVTNISDQFLFGDALMVCPVYTYNARERVVYFPKGVGWFDLHSASYIEGGQQIMVPAPYEEMPIYIRSGSIIPYGSEIQFVGEKPEEPLIIYVYAGADGDFTLYEDEGLNYDYEQGAYSKIQLTYNEELKKLVIGKREGTYEGMVEERTIQVVYVDIQNPKPLDFAASYDYKVLYQGEEISFSF